MASHLLVIYTPLGNTLCDVEPMDAVQWLWVAVLAGAAFATVRLIHWFRPGFVPV